METTLPYNPAKRDIIREHMRIQEQDALAKHSPLPKTKLNVKGTSSYEPIYSLPLDILYFNKANGRIRAEIIEKEAELGREFDHWSKVDQEEIKKILLSMNVAENEKIKEDLIKNTQSTPGIIACDGVVINGNRRKALLEEISKNAGYEKYKYLDVQVLPTGITKDELWLIEAGLQMSAPQQLNYTPINNLLKLREGVFSGLSEEQIASRLYGVTELEIKNDLDRLKLIDEYLKDFIGKEGKYYLADGLNEHFIDLQSILNWAQRPRGNKKIIWEDGPTESDINELKLVGFYYIRMKLPHLRIRGLSDHFAIESSWKEQRKVLDIDIELTEEEKKAGGILVETEVVEENEEEEIIVKDVVNPILTTAEEIDVQEEQTWINSRKNNLKVIYEDSKEQEQIIKNQEKPFELAKKALKNIRGIVINNKSEIDPKLDSTLGSIINETNKKRKTLHKLRS